MADIFVDILEDLGDVRVVIDEDIGGLAGDDVRRRDGDVVVIVQYTRQPAMMSFLHTEKKRLDIFRRERFSLLRGLICRQNILFMQ